VSPNTSRGGQSAAVGLLAAGVAAMGVALFWGFTVDDAWITARVAWRLATGQGYRFNTTGAGVDAVTPLGWVFLLVPFAGRSALDALLAARVLGAATWLAAAVWFGYRLRSAEKEPFYAVVLLASAPLGAWASAGMETGLVMALATLALGQSTLAAVAAATVAAWRPEMIPFCAVLGLRPVADGSKSVAWRFGPLALTLAFPAVVALLRHVAFGRAIPLAALAKPSDLQHGLRYCLGALLFLGPTWLLLGNGYKALSRQELITALGVAIHFATIVAVGGDWMPMWRLAVPVMPAALWVAACLHTHQRPLVNLLGLAGALGVSLVVGYGVGIPARHVYAARLELINRARPLLSGLRQVAALDVGWVGVAYPGEILDMAGVTDPRIARLVGGHTTKKIPNSWFDAMQPDGLVLLTAPGETLKTPWQETAFARVVENRVKAMPYWRSCAVSGTIDLSHTSQQYVVVRCP
jgi:hypothetical protein